MEFLYNLDDSMIEWSRAQFALTAIYHWLFVPLTLGLAVIMGIAETCYYRTKKPFWKDVAKFWQKLFGVNFAMGVATGIILEFEFGTNWSNYSWFVGDIFGAPLAYVASECGWLVAEFGRQPWTIQDMLPTWASVSNLQSASVIVTFFIFLVLFTTMLAVEINILLKQIKKGPES